MKGKYVFLDATEEEKDQAERLEKGLDGPKKIFWRLQNILPESPHHIKLKSFHDDLVKFNQKINLVSNKSIYDADVLHFLDSYLAAESLLADCQSSIIYDFGSGNGFPGIIMALLAPNRKFVLLDTDNRKVEFIKHIATKLALKNIAAHKKDVATINSEGVETAVCRGFASISKTLLMTRKAFAPGASFYHLKGPMWSNEVAEMPSQLIALWTPEMIYEYKLSNTLGERFLIKTTLST